MTPKDTLKLTLPNDLSYLPNAQAFVVEAARRFGFSEAELMPIEVGVEEAVTNVMKHAYDAEESRDFEIVCEKLPAGIRIIVREKGMPFDPAQVEAYRTGASIEETSARGLGTFLMQHLMDEVTFHNLGTEGKETRLVKYRKDKTALESEQQERQAAATEPAVIVEKIDYDVRGLDPREAIQVSRCAFKSHGYSFFDEHIYYPERLVAMNRSGEMISAVAVTKERVFMGHAALVYQYPDDRIAELTFVFVNVEYRGQGAFNRLIEYLFTCPKTRGLRGIYAYAVSNHVFTQKAMARYQVNDCGILLATSPSSWKFRGIPEAGAQRISVILGFKYMGPPEKRRLYPPARHRAMIEKLYRNIGAADHEYAEPDSATLPPAGDADLLTGVNAAEGCAEIFIRRYGADAVTAVRKALRQFCVQQVACVNLFLNLEDPATALLAAEFEKLGFFFAGILPCSRIGDALVLQYLNNVALDYGKIVAYSDVARELLAYIRELDPNADL
ncbi:MAG TPA: ATP-binding protein [Kiritimatiellia bacterium]|nr:ATP-binding protein [Kiritimatiellia bacterium]HRZ13712.1 ATP-binding protein [Kiritimatiellia bacterium]HSA19380.1 ATP-binding protein [Kiritimatiellia bacterium]